MLSLLLTAGCSSDDSARTGNDPAAEPATSERSVDGTTAVEPDRSHRDAVESSVPPVVEPGAALRCQRLGYACSLVDVDAAAIDRALGLAAELSGIVDDAADPAVGLEEAADHVSEMDDLVELIVDREAFTGLMFRLDGTPEFYVVTDLAEPIGLLPPLDLSLLGTELATLADAAQPTGFSRRSLSPAPRSYHPAGGPRVQKTGIVIDPYAVESGACPPGIDRPACPITAKGRVEGSVVHAIMDAHPQITAEYLAGSDAAPWNFTNLSGYDLVHVVSHGSSGCAGSVGWSGGFSTAEPETPEQALEQWNRNFRNTPYDPNACYSMVGLGPFDKEAWIAAGSPAREPGVGLGCSTPTDCGMFATTEYFVGRFGAEAIVYFSNCTSADGQLAHSAKYGSFVGWHSYALMSTAVEAATSFWRLMVVDGVEFEVASSHLAAQGLDWSVAASAGVDFGDESFIPSDVAVGASVARLATVGRNQRARDVITIELDAKDPNGGILQVDGVPGDGKPERFPLEGQVLSFVLEGVKSGSAADVTVEFSLGGVKLEPASKLDLTKDGAQVDPSSAWSGWKVQIDAGTFEIPDTEAADYVVGGALRDLEVRAFTTASEYTADGGGVRLATDLIASGPLPLFGELAAAIGGQAQLSGNDLRIKFNSAGGPVTGNFEAKVTVENTVLLEQNLTLDGTYDPSTGAISGDVTGVGRAGVGGTAAGVAGTEPYSGRVDVPAGTVTVTFPFDERPYVGTFVAE